VLWRIFVCKRDEVTEGWRKLHNEELLDLNFTPDVGIFKKNCNVVGACGVHGGEKRNACRLMVGKSEGKCRNECRYNMKVNLKVIGYSNEVMKRFMWFKVGISAIQFREFVDWHCSMLLPWDGLLCEVNHFTKPLNDWEITVGHIWHHLPMHFCC